MRVVLLISCGDAERAKSAIVVRCIS